VTPAAIVGVGAGAASLDSLARLFSRIDGDLGAAYLVAVRQGESLTATRVVEALSREGGMPVEVAQDGTALLPNRIYVGPSGALITLEGGHIRAEDPEGPHEDGGAIDSLLISLAEEHHERTVAVILAGLGSHGVAGVVATKGCGGLALAELAGDHEEASDQAVTAAGITDRLLPLDEIPGQIASYVRSLARVDQAGGWEKLEKQASVHIAQIATILRDVTGNDFHGYKQNTFLAACSAGCRSPRSRTSTPMSRGCERTAKRCSTSFRTC
jgi:two-component system CheB/CheR fusion protein